MTVETKESTKDQILVPRTGYVQGKEFESLIRNGNYHALKELKEQGYFPVFMPQLIDARIEAPKDSRLWQVWYSTPTVRATGKTSSGNKVVVYAHTENYLSNPENLKKALSSMVNYAGRIPQEEFQGLVDKDGMTDESGNRLVWVIDYDTLRKSSSGVIKVAKALEHPQTIPFIGGEERTQKYLERHKEVYGNNIGIWHSDDLNQYGNEPLGRLLCVGSYDYDGLSGGNDLNDDVARFVGVRNGAEGAMQKISSPNLEQVLKASEEFVPPVARKDFETRLAKLYQ